MSALPSLDRGDEVSRAADRTWRGVIVDGPRAAGNSTQYLVAWTSGGSGRSWLDATQLARLEPESLTWAAPDSFLADLALLKFFHEFSDVLFSIGSSRTQFLVYQFKPVLQFIRQSSHGLLVADEVGLGKTVEAALILRELLARGDVQRLLVVCPANLRRKWQSELRQRFGIELREMRSRDFRQLAERFEREGLWPSFFAVTSLEGLRATDFERTLQETGINFDLVIVDEAHHLRNPETRSFELGQVLTDQSDHVVMLSATPIQTGQSDLLSLLRLVDPAEFRTTSLDDLDALLEPNRYINGALAQLSRPAPDLAEVAEQLRGALGTVHGAGYANNGVFMSWLRRLEDLSELTPEATVSVRRDLQRLHTLAPYYTRTRKREVEEAAERRAQVIHVPLTEPEQEFYDAWVDFLAERARALHPGLPPGWSIIQRERQAASCLPAARAKLDDLIGDTPIGDDFEGSDPDPASEGNGAVNSSALTQAVSRVREAAERLPDTDSKITRFIGLLRDLLAQRPERKLLVFTFFRPTVQYLRAQLREAGIGCATIWGDTPPEQRADIVEAFREDPETHVLLSTEVGSEGLDFQFCDVIVNYDLPWNPMRVEQRIGRIDRYGQREPQVVVASFFVEETIDTRILFRLYDRIRVFEESIGELEPILGPVISELQADVFTRGLTDDEQARRANDATLRLEQRRLDLEEFESARAELMGQGDLLRQEIEATRTSGRYVSPAEVRSVVGRWLRRVGEGRDGLKPTRQPEVFDLEMSSAAVNRVYQWMSRQRLSHPDAQRLLQRINSDHHAWVTFESEVAREFERLPFLHIGHPLVATVIEELNSEEPPGWIGRVGSFALPPGIRARMSAPGVALSVYRVGVRGLERQETILPVATDLASMDVIDGLGDELLGALPDAFEAPPPEAFDRDALLGIEQGAFEYADARRRGIERLAREQQVDRIAVRRATLERTFRARIDRKREIQSRIREERIIRLYDGQVRNLEAELDRQVEELDRAPQPSADLEMLAMAVFSPVPRSEATR